MMDDDATVTRILALLHQETGAPCGWGHHRSARRRHLRLSISRACSMCLPNPWQGKNFHEVYARDACDDSRQSRVGKVRDLKVQLL
jgi:hypothetical protein